MISTKLIFDQLKSMIRSDYFANSITFIFQFVFVIISSKSLLLLWNENRHHEWNTLFYRTRKKLLLFFEYIQMNATMSASRCSIFDFRSVYFLWVQSSKIFGGELTMKLCFLFLVIAINFRDHFPFIIPYNEITRIQLCILTIVNKFGFVWNETDGKNEFSFERTCNTHTHTHT